ncbi:hypothetical protein [Pseudomonas sp. CGJS7]|uniref:hypothetical protein n=1 Tax=Pseudomonas sp. CGJS7 TaxID=3109348 RepID=UPI0030085CC5
MNQATNTRFNHAARALLGCALGLTLAGTAAAQTPLRGWQLTPTNTGLTAVGLRCDNLPLYTGASKPAPGSVLSEVRIDKPLDLSAGDITIERSCIRPKSISSGTHLITTTDYGACVNNQCPPAKGRVIIRDSEISGALITAQRIAKSCAFIGVGILQRNYIHSMGSGICFYNTGAQLDALAEGNYVHKLRSYGSGSNASHNSAATVRDFSTGVNPLRRMGFRNNRLDISAGNDTGALFLQTAADIDQVHIEGNLFEGGGYQLILEARWGNDYGRAMSVVDNRFSGTGWGYGYVTDEGLRLGYGWNEWRDNYRNAPTQPDNRGSVVVKPEPNPN